VQEQQRRPRAAAVEWGEREVHGAAPESNRPSDGLRRLTRFEDALGHRAPPLHERPGA